VADEDVAGKWPRSQRSSDRQAIRQ